LVHQRAHVVHDGVDSGHLAKDDHDVCVDEGAAGAGDTGYLVRLDSKDEREKGRRT
jgi:hypothetical protein